jgi:hypothetical protein
MASGATVLCGDGYHCASTLLTTGESLKVKKLYAEELSVHADLFAHEGAFTPRPAWQVIEAARRQMLTGELALATTPSTKVYLRDGHVYFAERTTDGGLGVRLLVEGVITRQQMGKGALLVSGVEHLGRMFQRDPSIDRQSVELCVELMTDDVLTSVANVVIDHYTMSMYKRHPNGIDRWLPTRIELITHIVEGSHLADPDAVITPGTGVRHRPHVAPAPAAPEPEVVVAEVAVAEVAVAEVAVAQVVAEPVVAEQPVAEEAVELAAADDEVALVAPVMAEPVVEEAAVEEPSIFKVLALGDITTEQPVVDEFATDVEIEAEVAADGGFDVARALALAASMAEAPDVAVDEASTQVEPDVHLSQAAMDSLMSSAIADEVAEAVRRALSAIDSATKPLPTFSPADFNGPSSVDSVA